MASLECAGRFCVALAMVVLVLVRDVHAVSGIYVNNHKIDKFETDRVKLLRPADAHVSTSYVSKNELLTKGNFTNLQQYYQYLVGEDPVKYIDLLWGKNKTQLPSIFRPGSGSASVKQQSAATLPPITASNLTRHTFNYSDDQSAIKNTLNNTNLAYFGDYQRPSPTQSTVLVAPSQLQPISTTRTPTGPSRKRRKKKPTTVTTIPTEAHRVSVPAKAGSSGTSVSDHTKTELSPETLSLLSRYYSFSCTLTPIQPTPSAYPTTSSPPPISTTRRTKKRYLTTKPPVKATTQRPKPGPVPTIGKQKKPIVYVDPPVIKRIGGMLESVYTFMENALTSTEYVEDSEETRAAKDLTLPNETISESVQNSKSSKVKRNTYTKVSASESDILHSNSGEGDSASRSTLPGTDQTWLPLSNEGTSSITKHFTPKLVTISGLPSTISTDGNKNKMTTNIQVTSEYTAATPPTVTLGKPKPDDSSADYDESSDEESEEDYFDGFGGFEETDDDDEDDEDDEEEEENGEQYGPGSSEPVRPNHQTALSNDKDYEEVGTHMERPLRIKRVKKRRRKKRPVASYEDTAEYSDEDSSDEADDEYEDRDESIGEDEDDEDDYESGESPGDAEGFFSRMFSTFGRFVRSLGFGGAARGSPDDYDDYGGGGGARSTTPRVQSVRRRPTRSTSETDAYGVAIDRDERYPSGYVSTPERSPSDWLYLPGSYLVNDLEEEIAPTLEIPSEIPFTPSTSDGWFDLMMPWDFLNPWTSAESSVGAEDQEEVVANQPITEIPPPQHEIHNVPTPSSPVSGWFSQFFGASTTSTPPTATTTLPKPEQILSVLAQYVAQTATTKRPTVAGLVRPTKQPTRTVSYTSYQLWRIFVHTEDHLQRLEDYRQSPDGVRLQWWSTPTLLRPTDVLVPPGTPADSLREYLDEEGLRYEPTIRDVGQAIAYENPRTTRREQLELELVQGHPLTWYRYHRYADIVKFMHHLQRRHPQRVQLLHIGRSYEGRPITVVRVSFAASSKGSSQARPKRARKATKKRPAIFVEAGTHGHEWIGPSVATWLLNRLLEMPESFPANGTPPVTESGEWRIVQSYDWYVLPVLNPDGYEYSHKYDRLWSKNRSNQTQSTPSGVGQALLSSAINWWNANKPQLADNSRPFEQVCYGADLNRNWAYRWQQASDAIVRSQCSVNYAGSEPFSEPESRALRDFLLTRRRNVRIYLSLQAYGQLLTYPEIDSITIRQGERYEPDTYGDVHEMATAGLEAMRAEPGEFLYSVEPEAGPPTYGTAAGYARHGAGIRYSYTLRLPDRGTHGFLLPPSSIVPIGRDVFELLKGMVEYN
uniref:Peptidase M14 domain-containing protein n=1 Tax=Anopheles christyi TaxID=43041 RepID=A0A182KE71_9DIPT